MNRPLGRELGYVDLRFDGDDGTFTLFVENKLHSDYGHEQIPRYREALRHLPGDGARGLLAITRNVPGFGEPDGPGTQGWWGSVRWAHMLDELRALEPVNTAVTEQWRTLLDVLDDQGDLGRTTLNTELLEAWGKYFKGRDHLTSVLADLQERALDVLRDELKTHRHRGSREDVADGWRYGKAETFGVRTSQSQVWFGLAVPARARQPSIIVQFDNTYWEPVFSVQAELVDAEARMAARERQLTQASNRLTEQGFKTNPPKYSWWARTYGPDDWLHDADVPGKLMEFIEKDIAAIVASRALQGEVVAAAKRGAGQLPRGRRSY